LENFRTFEKGTIVHGALKKISHDNPPSEIVFPAGIEFEGKDAKFEEELGGSEKQYIVEGPMVFENGKLKYPVKLKAGWAMKNQLLSWLEGKETYDSKGQKVLRFFFNKQGILWYEKERERINPKTVFSDKGNTKQGSQELEDLFNERILSFPKPTKLIMHLVKLSREENNEIVFDFFAGSGTTAHSVINLNREDNGNLRYILVEMANYFDTILLPRVKKVVYCENWGSGKPEGGNAVSHFLKYQALEQYDDALDNLELKPNEPAQKLFKDDYLLKYFLEFETQDSPNFLNIEHLKDPFSYKLKVNFEEMGEPVEAVVDIPETFNYLLGLKVKKIKARQNLKRKYLFTLGEKEGINIAVVWRKVDDNWDEDDFRKDKEFIIKELKAWMPQRIYINGQSILTTNLEGHPVEIHYIEPDFKTLMFS
jgi:adenine-specific DNA-methyltransferase